MNMKEIGKVGGIISFILSVITFELSTFKNEFISAFLLMLALLMFSLCLYVGNKKKVTMYILFILGILLVLGSLVYMIMRII